MKLDKTAIIGFPDSEDWEKLYRKHRETLVSGLNGKYCLADREDAVEEAFHKLMHRKDVESYGDAIPQTEADWFWQIHWQARAFLSHMRERADRHAKYIERAAQDALGMIAAVQGLDPDDDICSKAVAKAFELLCREQDISRRNIRIYIRAALRKESAKSVSRLFHVTENHVYQIKFRIKNLIRRHGLDCLRRVLGEK